jgi:hypothetical protein
VTKQALRAASRAFDNENSARIGKVDKDFDDMAALYKQPDRSRDSVIAKALRSPKSLREQQRLMEDTKSILGSKYMVDADVAESPGNDGNEAPQDYSPSKAMPGGYAGNSPANGNSPSGVTGGVPAGAPPRSPAMQFTNPAFDDRGASVAR